jgi:pimeloyl-ACP methyl ester carboxylesterase
MMLAGLSVSQSGMPRVHRLMLSAPVNPWSRHGRLITRILATRPASTLFRAVEPLLGTTHNFFLRRMYGDVSRIKPGTLEGYSEPLKVPGTTDHLLSIVRSWQSGLRDIETVLPNIADVPTLLIWGGRDKAVFPESAEPLKAQFRNAELVVIPGAGHLPYEEVPEEFNRIVLDFLGRAEGQN